MIDHYFHNNWYYGDMESGGGTALYIRNSFQCTRFNNFVHNNNEHFEITWVIVRPPYLPCSITVLALACVFH